MQSILENTEAQPNVKMFYLLPPKPYTHLEDSCALQAADLCRHLSRQPSEVECSRGTCRKLCLLNALSDGYHRN